MLTFRTYFPIEITGPIYAFFLVHDMLTFSPFEKYLFLKFALIFKNARSKNQRESNDPS